MGRKRTPSLARLAALADPFEDEGALRARLLQTKAESRFLEWKLLCPVGPNVPLRLKYRTVKVLVSFANTDGGFVVCGVDPRGRWVGLSNEDLAHVDPAKITELLGGIISPEIPRLNYTEMEHRGKKFVIIHVPPSEVMPHVTTKAIREKRSDGRPHTILSPRAVYCRYGAKSDLATPASLQRIVTKRTEFLKDDLLRRIKEVRIPIPVPAPSKSGSIIGPGTLLRVTRLTDDPTAPAVRLTHKKSEASGIFVHEELSDGLFDEINNVVGANHLLAKGQKRFLLGEPLYYRVYAERQHVVGDADLFEILAHAAFREFYAPGLFWLLQLRPAKCAEIIASLYKDPKAPKVHNLLRLAILLGPDFSQWLLAKWQHRWRNHPQPPDYFWTFTKMMNRKDTKERLLVALRSKHETQFPIPDVDTRISYRELLDAPPKAAKLLSEACMHEFKQDHRFRTVARQLDYLAYGVEFVNRASSLAPIVIEATGSESKQQDAKQSAPADADKPQ